MEKKASSGRSKKKVTKRPRKGKNSDLQNGNDATSTSEYKESSDFCKSETDAASRRVSPVLGQVKPNS